MIKDWIKEYAPQSESETLAALREIMQEVVLAGLSRTDFFEHAAFYGGTALRIFYGLERFSEDLDFSLLKENAHFSLEPYFNAIITEFNALGLSVVIKEKEKKIKSSVESAFLKSETIWKELVLEDFVKQLGIRSNLGIKIKIEVDRHPPLNFSTEQKLLLRPFSFYVKCFTLPCLFAGKLHALLFRKWKNRVKGRDWFDMEWYIRKGVPVDLVHFLQRAKDTNDWQKDTITLAELKDLIDVRISEVSIDRVKEDVLRFIKNDNVLAIWSPEYFKDLAQMIKSK